jgi:hypothetical protein
MSKVCAQPVLNYFSGTPPENSGGAENAAENSGTNDNKLFLLYVRIEYATTGLGSRN